MKTWKPKLAPFRKFKIEYLEERKKLVSFIYQIGESEDLRKRSKDVPLSRIKSKEYKNKFKYLKNCLKKYRKLTGKGRGITAVQVGVPERFSVIYTPEKSFMIINPKITKKSAKKLIYPEMCMSADPIVAPTTRPSWVEFEYFDEEGNKKLWKTKDKTKLGIMMNRVFQHEIDHMDGIINIDKVASKDLFLLSNPKFYDKAKFEEV